MGSKEVLAPASIKTDDNGDPVLYGDIEKELQKDVRLYMKLFNLP